MIPRRCATSWPRLVSVAFVAAALAAHSWRVRALKARQRRLDALVVEQNAALETRDVLLHTLAHDLKAPIASMAWQVQHMRRRARETRLDASLLEQGLTALGDGASEAMAAIDELHDLSRLAVGASLPLQRESVDLVALVRRAIRRRAESRHNLRFESSESKLFVQGDSARLARVLDNLLDNATKYGSLDKPGTVRVDRADAEGIEWAVVRVEDHGLGIPRADLSQIFERHHRGQNVTFIDGDGLGLASVRRLIELHAGSVEVRSKLGVGSTFTVKLPLSRGMDQVRIDKKLPELVDPFSADIVVHAALPTMVGCGNSVNISNSATQAET